MVTLLLFSLAPTSLVSFDSHSPFLGPSVNQNDSTRGNSMSFCLDLVIDMELSSSLPEDTTAVLYHIFRRALYDGFSNNVQNCLSARGRLLSVVASLQCSK